MTTRRSRWLAALVAVAFAIPISLFSSTAPASAAERPDSLGKEFWLAFPQNYNGTPALSLFISAPTATSGTVSVPGLGFSENFSVTPGAVTTVVVPDAAQLTLGNSGNPENRAIHVTAAAEVAVYGLNRIQYTTDAFLGLPVDVQTTEYVVLAFPYQFSASEFAVVATDDGTDVTYVPTANTTSGVTSGTPKTTTLNKGEALPVSSTTGDLSGTTITSTKPVAVMAGQQCADVPTTSYSACDHLLEQIPATAIWGKTFQTVPLKTRIGGDTFRIVAKDDNTAVAINGATVATLNKGQVHQQIIDGQSTITADKPVLVAQYSNGSSFDNVTSDPFMMLITPSEQYLSDYTFTTPATGFAQNFVNVVTPTSAIGQVKLDGAVVPAGAFTPIGSSGFSGAQLDLTLGSHTMTSTEPFATFVYGFDEYDSYGYPGGGAYAQISAVASLTLTPPTQQVVVNNEACLTSTVADKNGKGLAGIQVKLKITGVNPGTFNGLTDSTGVFKHCYKSTQTGTDTATASFDTLSATATVNWVKAKPAKRKQLPINTTKVKKSPAELNSNDQVRLVKTISTNKHGNLSVRAFCRPANPAAAGEVRFCDINVSKKGKVTVRSTGYDKLKVTVRVKATPKKGQADKWRSNSWRKTWTVRG